MLIPRQERERGESRRGRRGALSLRGRRGPQIDPYQELVISSPCSPVKQYRSSAYARIKLLPVTATATVTVSSRPGGGHVVVDLASTGGG